MTDLAAFEHRFRRAGLPLFISDYSAREDVFTRAIPFLGFVFMLQMLAAVNFEWSTAANVAAVTGGLALLLTGVGFLNRHRGARFVSVPRRVGGAELVTFVVLPALLPLIFGGQAASAAVTAFGQLLTLAVVYYVVGYGLFAIVRWTGARLVSTLVASIATLSRALPLLLVVTLVLFLTTEMWQVFSDMPGRLFALSMVSVMLIGSVFLVARLPREISAIERASCPDGPPLDRRQRLNVGLVMFVSQALQVLVVSFGTAVFFTGFGLIAVDEALLTEWVGRAPEAIEEFTLVGSPVILSRDLLEVSGAMAGLSGLYYAIAVLTDPTYREEFLQELTEEMAGTFRARSEYLALLTRSP